MLYFVYLIIGMCISWVMEDVIEVVAKKLTNKWYQEAALEILFHALIGLAWPITTFVLLAAYSKLKDNDDS